jgi:hypothetical protein
MSDAPSFEAQVLRAMEAALSALDVKDTSKRLAAAIAVKAHAAACVAAPPPKTREVQIKPSEPRVSLRLVAEVDGESVSIPVAVRVTKKA